MNRNKTKQYTDNNSIDCNEKRIGSTNAGTSIGAALANNVSILFPNRGNNLLPMCRSIQYLRRQHRIDTILKTDTKRN